MNEQEFIDSLRNLFNALEKERNQLQEENKDNRERFEVVRTMLTSAFNLLGLLEEDSEL